MKTKLFLGIVLVLAIFSLSFAGMTDKLKSVIARQTVAGGGGAVERTGSVYYQRVTSDSNDLSVTVPADADICIVFSTGRGDGGDMDITELSWDDGAALDFTIIVEEIVASPNWDSGFYYMLSNDGNWPGTGAQTIYATVTTAGTSSQGFNLYAVFYKNVAFSSTIIDTETGDSSGSGSYDTSMSTAGAGDMGIIGFAATPGADVTTEPTGYGQTEVQQDDRYSSRYGIVEELGEDALRLEDLDFYSILAFVLAGG